MKIHRLVIIFCLMLLNALAPRSALADQKSSYYIMIDVSGSMAETPKDWAQPKIAAVRKSLGEFLPSLPQGTEIYLYSFNTMIRQTRHVTLNGEADKAALLEFVNKIDASKSWTYAWRNLDIVLNTVAQTIRGAQKQTANVLIYTDGEDNEVNGPNLDSILTKYHQFLTANPDESRILAYHISLGYTPRQDVVETYRKHNIPVIDDAIIPLIANFDWSPAQPSDEEPVKFRDSSGGSVKAYAWDFGNGQSSAQKDPPPLRYAKEGVYAVTLTLTDAQGTRSVKTQKITVSSGAAVADFTFAPERAAVGETVRFSGQCRGAITAYAWDFGDGEKAEIESPSHVYGRAGAFEVELRLKSPSGKTAAARKTVRVSPNIVARINGAGEARLGEAVQFFDASNGAIQARRWDFGDGESSEETHPKHEFKKAGAYTVKLVCTGPGGQGQAEHRIQIAPAAAPTANFEVSNAAPKLGDKVFFTISSAGVIEKATWDFGDGSKPVEIDFKTAGENGGKIVEHVYSKEGKYNAKLVVAGPGGQAECSKPIEPTNGIQVKFAASDHAGRTTLTVEFTNETTGAPVDHYVWKFGDDTPPVTMTSTEPVKHTYKPGHYKAMLNAYPLGGGSAVAYADPDEIVVKPPWPWWLIHMLWAIPALIVGLYAILAIINKLKRIRECNEAMILRGRLKFRPEHVPDLDDDLIPSVDYNFQGKFPMERFALNGTDTEVEFKAMECGNKFHLQIFRSNEPVGGPYLLEGEEVDREFRHEGFVFHFYK